MPRVKEIKVALGVSLDTGEAWVKPHAELTLELDVEDTPQNRKKYWEKAWAEIQEQVSKQLNELTN